MNWLHRLVQRRPELVEVSEAKARGASPAEIAEIERYRQITRAIYSGKRPVELSGRKQSD